MPKVSFIEECLEVECESGQTVGEVAEAHGINVFRGIWQGASCRRYGFCGRCKVWVMPRAEGAASPPTFWERVLPKVTGAVRLACQARVLGDVEVRTRPGGPPVQANLAWQPDGRHYRWQDRLAGSTGGDDEGDEEKSHKPAAATAKKPAPSATPAASTATAGGAAATTTVSPATEAASPPSVVSAGEAAKSGE